MNNVLVTYASQYDSTKEIALEVGHKLQEFQIINQLPNDALITC